MHNDENPRPSKNRGPIKIAEKPKNFSIAVIRLIKELKIYKYLLILALVLASFASILTIISPNKLSSLTNEISNGIMINTKNLEKLNILIQTEGLTKSIKIDDVTISIIDQYTYLEMVKQAENKDKNQLYSLYNELPESIKKVIEPKMDIEKIKTIVITLASIYLISSLFSYIQALIMTNISNNFAKGLRSRISSKINRLPLKYFDLHQTGDILSRITNDVDTTSQSISNSSATLVSSLTLFLGTIIMMFVTNYILALTAIFASVIGFVFMALILSKSQKYFVLEQEGLGKVNAHVEEVYSGLNIVRAYNGKKQMDKKFDKLNDNMYNATKMSQFLGGLMPPLMNFIGNFGYVAVCIVGAILTMKGKISFGTIIAFITYVRLFISPLSQLASTMTSIQSAAAASERVFEFLDEEEMEKEENKKYLDPKIAKGNIEFKNIEFTYFGNKKPTIKNFSAKIKPGQKIAIVGPTGSGKTTMVNLLMKFYNIEKGNILIDGVSINDLTRENIHSLFTIVLQDTWLFDGTIKENIKYNFDNVTDEEVKNVCKIVGIDHFIKTLPKGYNSEVTDSDIISSGQRQLITIARGMIKSSPFLILDEATSNVDTRTEELVSKSMDKLAKGKTSFIIAHRLSTIKNADLILVMKDGNIIEQGNHEELLKRNGFYKELYNSQFEL